MPLIDPWTECPLVDSLDAASERFFIRLKSKLDDYGRFTANVRLLNSSLFPLKNDIRDTDISRWLAACQTAGLLRCYGDLKGRPILEVFDAKQRKRFMKSEFDPPEGQMTMGLVEEKQKMKRREEKKNAPPAPPSAKGGTTNNQQPTTNAHSKVGQTCGFAGKADLGGAATPPNRVEPDPIAHGATEVPDEKTAIEQAGMRAIPADFARMCFTVWTLNNGCDANNRSKPWLAYVATRWVYEAVEWRSGKHRGKQSASAVGVSNGPTRAEVYAYAKEKGDDHCTYACQWFSYWVAKDWKRKNGDTIDWKVDFQNQFARSRQERSA